MKRNNAILLIGLALAGMSGCSMCCGPYDYDYPTFGGKHERADRSYGRVGSLFSDPYAGYAGEPADSNREFPEGRDLPYDTSGDGSELENDIRRFKQELESIDPGTGEEFNGQKSEELPEPEVSEKDPTANRSWQRRAQGRWR